MGSGKSVIAEGVAAGTKRRTFVFVTQPPAQLDLTGIGGRSGLTVFARKRTLISGIGGCGQSR